ncbi:MAG: hypothetical protein GYA15_05435 [Leptolinea sp.]|jgi:hypothetical protein|nr:hypothetical protein [Leptolinea sp.]
MKSSAALTVLIPLLIIITLTGCNMPLKPIPATAIPAAIHTIIPTITPPPTLPPVATENLPTLTASPTPEPEHKDLPGSLVGKIIQTVHDQVDDKTASQKQVYGGDDFRNGRYERPFDKDMNYLPEADLVTVQLNRTDPLWVYVLIKVIKPFAAGEPGTVNFMVEIDVDKDVRGDLLIVSGTPLSTEWSTDSVVVLTAPDHNVGGLTAVRPDGTPSEGRGYFEEIFNSGKGSDQDLAWSRLSKTDNQTMEIAFKNTLTGGEKGEFIWLAWADTGMKDQSVFDHNDHFTFSQSGYPVKDDAQNYPLKALWGIDNICRVASGFEPKANTPGLCPEVITPPEELPSGNHGPGTFCHRPCLSVPGCCD